MGSLRSSRRVGRDCGILISLIVTAVPGEWLLLPQPSSPSRHTLRASTGIELWHHHLGPLYDGACFMTHRMGYGSLWDSMCIGPVTPDPGLP